jgi:hypothetical protein
MRNVCSSKIRKGRFFNMKGKLGLVFGVLLVFGFVLVGCHAQSSNNEQQLAGTWTVVKVSYILSSYQDQRAKKFLNSTWTFNANETLVFERGEEKSASEYFAAGSKIYIDGEILGEFSSNVSEFSLSTDGKTLMVHISSFGCYFIFKKK